MAKQKKTSTEEQIVKENKEQIESSQPEINIGLIGHVDSGKTTVTYMLSSKWTDTHSEEIKRGITIRLGYADSVFRKCPECDLKTTKPECPIHKVKTEVTRKVSFVDAPGHESLMATMLSGAAIMDGALLVISANEDCPQPQTKEHLMALQIIGVKNIVIAQNKIDIVSKEQAIKNYEQIKTFIKDTPYKDAPIIPISAHAGINVDLLIDAIEKNIKTPQRDKTKNPIMFVARSFDINKPGADPLKINGGILGGSLKEGVLRVGDKIEIRPGRETEVKNKKVWEPIITEIAGLKTGGKDVSEVYPGGSIAILTKLDPAIVKSDLLSGSIVGLPGKLPSTLYEIYLSVNLLPRVVGTREETEVQPIKQTEPLMLNVNSAVTVGFVTEFKKNKIKCTLKRPICAEYGSRITISRRMGVIFRLIGYGILEKQ